MIVVLALMAAAVTVSGEFSIRNLLGAQKPTGEARLISFQPLPARAIDGEMCEWAPASTGSSLFAALQDNARSSGKAARSADVAFPADYAKRKPLRTIRDPYAAYSAVAVDVANNEVVLADENLFQMLVYDRQANTPPRASMTEPKRIIGGMKTDIEYQCGVYIDPRNGDIYAVNNDTLNKLVIFSREVRGDSPPTRELETPQGTFGIAVDEGNQELYLTVQRDAAIVVYRKDAKGNESPVRMIQGDHTLLSDPHGIALDTKNNLIYVTNHGSGHRVDPSALDTRPTGKREGVLTGGGKTNWPLGQSYVVPGSGKILPPSIAVYSKTASGDAAPVRVIQGPKAQLDWPTGIAIDPDRDELYVANDIGDSILVFRASASGDAAPIRVLKGPKSLVKNPTGVFLDTKNKELWVSNFGNHTATVYQPTAEGDTPPLRIIRSAPLDRPAPALSNVNTIAYDEKREQILVPN
jgi:DNA-binding beta-propeller fold protein YncE